MTVGVVVLLAVQVGTGWAIDTERSSLRDPVYFDKLALLRGHPAFLAGGPADRPTTVLFVGSSRTLNGVDAGALGPSLSQAVGRPVTAFNFAQAGAGPVTNAVYVRRLLKAGVRTDFVVIEVHPAFLAGGLARPPEAGWLAPVRLRPDELPVVRGLGYPVETPPAHGARGWLAPFYEYRFLILERHLPFVLMHTSRLNAGHESDRYGFTRLREVGRREAAILTELTRGQYAGSLPNYRPTGPGVAAVRDTLAQCRAAGWKAALLVNPESTAYRGWYRPEGLRELDAVLAGLAAEFGVPLFDTRAWLPDDLIGDGHHLTGTGADVYTDRLAREALAPWLAGAPAPRPGPTP